VTLKKTATHSNQTGARKYGYIFVQISVITMAMGNRQQNMVCIVASSLIISLLAKTALLRVLISSITNL
jgi:hypothetical protein